jgi:hypothetical protein
VLVGHARVDDAAVAADARIDDGNVDRIVIWVLGLIERMTPFIAAT